MHATLRAKPFFNKARTARNVHNVGNDFIAEVMGVRRTRNARSEDMGSAPGNTLSFYVASGAAKSSESGKTKKVVSETCECVCLRKGYLCYEAGRCARDAERKTRHDAHNGSPNVVSVCGVRLRSVVIRHVSVVRCRNVSLVLRHSGARAPYFFTSY